MVKVDLITGFLGSGKTTFLKEYAKYLIEQGENICILENDFGAVNVDMLMMQELLGEKCELEMVAGGCDKDCHKRRFKTKLIAMGMQGFDRVLIEPSGIFDVDEFFDTLREEPLDRWYEIGNIIAIVDAKLESDLSAEADYILASEIANAGKVVLSKVQETSKEQLEKTILHINQALKDVKCNRKMQKEIVCKDWSLFTTEDYKQLANCGYVIQNYRKLWLEQQNTFQSVYFLNLKISQEKLKITVPEMMQDKDCGKIFRIKGFLKEGGKWLELNATHDSLTVKPIANGQEVLIVIGEGLREDMIRAYLEKEKNEI